MTVNLDENVYNRVAGRDRPKLKVWSSVGLLLTYRCNAACRFCAYHCSPDRGGLMPVDLAIEVWEALKTMAGDRAQVHLSGGEPFLFWDRLVGILEAALRAGLGPVGMVETNGFWATDENQIRTRLEVLDALGVQRLKISCDPFHQEFVDLDRVRCLASIARDRLGPGRVLIRWEDCLDGGPPDGSSESWVRCMSEHPCRFTGRAASDLAQAVARRSVEDLRSDTCTRALLGAQGVHVDPWGHVFSGTCSGLIVGRVTDQPLDRIWRSLDPRTVPLVGTLLESGPVGLLPGAVCRGYGPLPAYADKCHLCTHVREFLHGRGVEPAVLGPAECYRPAPRPARPGALLRGGISPHPTQESL
ncbi:MAG: radical SAM protein [Phycisphaerae bacterium]|nr:radical SAM protein [Phycisphaerae bacterium]